MGDTDRDRGAPNLTPNVPIFTGLLAVEAVANRGRLVVPVSFSEFTEAFLVTITNRPTQTLAGFLEAGLQFLIGSERGAAPTFNTLDQAEYLGPGCIYRQAVPGWLEKIVIDARGVAPSDFNTRRDIVAQVIVYQLDRATRTDWRGSK